MRVCYRDRPKVGIQVTVLKTWKRGDIEAAVMSTSSGPKDYTANHIFAIFDRFPLIASVVMVRSEFLRSPPFLLVTNSEGEYFDMAGKEVDVDER